MLKLPECKSARKVFDFFEQISKIPHGSGSTDAIAEYLVNFANERGLEVKRDAANNVIIRKNATKGLEDRPAVIFQGHTDMVLAKEQNVNIDLQNEGLDLYVDGDFLRARGTTLGADDGIAVAYALAVLDSDDIAHPNFEAVFTSDEEIGLLGAAALCGDDVRGRLLINIDSDAEGIFTVGCAGGMRCDVERSFECENIDGYLYTVQISSLRGGHSGVEINRGRVNAIKALGELLRELDGIQIATLDCGNADNAIPRDASVSFISKNNIEYKLSSVRSALLARLVSLGENDARIDVSVSESAASVISTSDTETVLSLIETMPTGVLAMSSDVEGLVETSQNIGILKLSCGKLMMTLSVRSAKGVKKRSAADGIRAIAEKHGATVNEHGDYPAWEYKANSYLREVMCRVYENMYKKSPEVVIIHAGLECGLLSDKIEGLDCLSLGPDNFDIHTPEERLSISSAVRVWEYLIEVLKNI